MFDRVIPGRMRSRRFALPSDGLANINYHQVLLRRQTRVCHSLLNDKRRVPVGIYGCCLRSNDPPTPIIFQPQLFPTKTEAVTLGLPAFGNF
jgi:hypothetical protein